MRINKRTDLEAADRVFKAFADPTRLRILSLLKGGELCVCHLIEVLRLPQSTVSRHLAYLKRAELVESREEGTWNHYRLARPAGRLPCALLACLARCLDDVAQLRQDRRKLLSGCRKP